MSHQETGTDTLVLDHIVARTLADALASAAEELVGDDAALRGLLEEATTILGVDRTDALVPLAAARRGLDSLATDLRGRLELVERNRERVDELIAMFGIDEKVATAVLERVDRDLAGLRARGFGADESVAALAVVESFDLDLADAVAHSNSSRLGLLESLGQILVARSLGVPLDDLGALRGLADNFAVLDAARGGASDDRVSTDDLLFVVEHPWRFTPSQLLAARELLGRPQLRHRLDTAFENDEVFDGSTFGSSEPGDGLISEEDLRAFMLKAQVHTLLGPYADEIDVANDPTGVVDGYRSENDLRAFLADNPDLPEPVVAAVETALGAGWFDESWFEAHKDELAMGAALLASGVAVVATGGTASMLVVIGAGALGAGGATVAVNLAEGGPVLDDAFTNMARGGFIGSGVYAAAAGATALAVAPNGLARVAAVAGTTSGSADVVAAGGVDLLVPEEHEDIVHAVASEIGALTGGAALPRGATTGSPP